MSDPVESSLQLLAEGVAQPAKLVPRLGRPGIGRIVHLHLPGPDGLETTAAIITKLTDTEGLVHLTVFQADHLPGHTRGPIPYAPEPTAGCWSWPPRN